MSRWRRDLAPEVQRHLGEIPKDDQLVVRRAIRALPDGDVVRLRHHPGLYRLRVHNWRVIFESDDRQRRIHVLLVDRREVVYKRLRDLRG